MHLMRFYRWTHYISLRVLKKGHKSSLKLRSQMAVKPAPIYESVAESTCRLIASCAPLGGKRSMQRLYYLHVVIKHCVFFYTYI